MSRAGLGRVDLSVRVAARIRLRLPLQGSGLLVQDGDRRDEGADGDGAGGGDGRRLARLGAAQRGAGMTGALPGMSRRRARLRAADTCARVSFAALAGSGALPGGSGAPGASRPAKASSAAGKYSRSWCRSRRACRVRSQISVLRVRATTLTAAAPGLPPATARSWREPVRTMQYLDSGYLSAELAVSELARHGAALAGPLLADTSAQARAGKGYARADFAIDHAPGAVTCPQGKTSASSNPCTQRGKDAIVVQFSVSDCGPCPTRELCTKGKRRQLTLPPRGLAEARAAEKTTSFQAGYARRAGVEGTMHQATAHGARRARYRGLAKTRLDHVYMACALNLLLLEAYWNGTPLDRRRTSHLARLELSLAA